MRNSPTPSTGACDGRTGRTRRRRRWRGSGPACRRPSRRGRPTTPGRPAASRVRRRRGARPPRRRRGRSRRCRWCRRRAAGCRRRPSSAPAVPTTQGMPSWRAMIAVWLVGPAALGDQREHQRRGRGPAVSAGARSSATSTRRLVGHGYAGLGLADEPGDHPALDVAQVGDPLGHQAAHAGEHVDELLDAPPARRPAGRRRDVSCLTHRAAQPLVAGQAGAGGRAPRRRRRRPRSALRGEAVGDGRGDRVVVRRQGGVLVGEGAAVEARDRRRARPRPRTTRAGPWATPGTTGVPRQECLLGSRTVVAMVTS